jgi:hypothetical protein
MNVEHFNEKICIVVQGPITFYREIIETYYKIKDNVIISTNDSNQIALKELNLAGFNIVKCELSPISGRANINNQVLTTYLGIIKAKEKGCDYVFKIRSDIFINKVVDLINKLDFDKVYFPAFHQYDGGYLCDYMIFGETDFMLDFWSIPISTSNLPPEIQLTNRFDEINNGRIVDFIFPILYNYNIIAYWAKYDKYLNDYQKDPLFIYERR